MKEPEGMCNVEMGWRESLDMIITTLNAFDYCEPLPSTPPFPLLRLVKIVAPRTEIPYDF